MNLLCDATRIKRPMTYTGLSLYLLFIFYLYRFPCVIKFVEQSIPITLGEKVKR